MLYSLWTNFAATFNAEDEKIFGEAGHIHLLIYA